MSVQDNGTPGATQWHALPQELRDRPQWLLAKGKQPMALDDTGQLVPGSSTNRAAWMTFPHAAALAAERGMGLGYVLAADDPFTCIDLDVKPGTLPEHLARLQAVSHSLASYTEASISGLGAHIWVRGNIGPGRKRDGVELYSQERFIVCTGRVVHDAPIADRQAMLDNMVSQMPKADSGERLPDVVARLADAQVWADARAHMGAELFDAVCRGDYVTAGKPSGSELDAKLLEALMFVGATDEQCRRLYVTTPLAARIKDGKQHMLDTDRLLDKAVRYARRQWAGRQEAQAAAQAHGAAQAAALLARVQQGPQVAPQQPQPAAPAPWQPAGPAAPASGAELLARYRVDLTKTAKAVQYLWGTYLIEGECAFLGGHGGKGKSYLALQIACHLAAGEPLLGKGIERQHRVLFYSAEDGEDRVIRRVHAICAQARLNPEAVLRNLCVIDATSDEFNPLFGEVEELQCLPTVDDKRPFYYYLKRSVAGTDDYARLGALTEAFDAEVLVVDGASDTFDADELKRAHVRAFMRALVRARPARKMTVLLLGHVNKVTAGNKRSANDDEGYSGSTALHNSARARLFLDVLDKGQSVLKHKKNQDGPLEADLFLERPGGSHGSFALPVGYTGSGNVPAPPGAAQAQPVDHTALLLRLLHHYTAGGASVSSASNSSASAYNTFKSHPSFPSEWKGDSNAKAARAQVQELMELAASRGLIEAEAYTDGYRNARTRWRLTEQGATAMDAGLR
jgi:hypothetical protein